MRNNLIICLMFLVLSSCYKVEKPNKPANLISKDKMVSVLIDMSIMSSAKGVNKKLLESNGIIPDSFIYKKHKIDSLIFAKSTNYYAFDIKTFEEIYTEVHDSLIVLRDNYKAIETKEKKAKEKIDSAKRAKIKAEKLLKIKDKNKNKKTKTKSYISNSLKPLKAN